MVSVSVILHACTGHANYRAAIHDFRPALRPYLSALVSRGVVGGDTSIHYIEKSASDKELMQLSKCEHPVLRSVAFIVMLDRPSFDHFSLIMNNLDDTAVVPTYEGEFGIAYHTVSDNLLYDGKWKDTVERKKTFEAVMIRHSHLMAGYEMLSRMQLKEAYYPIIREMAFRYEGSYEEFPFNMLHRLTFYTREFALYALAAFKKKEDIPLIKQMLLTYTPELGSRSFDLMRQYPDTSYIEVYQRYYRSFYRKLLRDGTFYDTEPFMRSLASLKNQSSAVILNSMLLKKPFMTCNVDTVYLRRALYEAIWDNRCDAYATMLEKIEPQIRKWRRISELSGATPFSIDTNHFIDTAKEPVGWWR